MLLLKQEQAVLEPQRGRVWRALPVFNPSLWESVRSPKTQFHLEQLLAQPRAPWAVLTHNAAAGGWDRHIHTPRDTPGGSHPFLPCRGLAEPCIPWSSSHPPNSGRGEPQQQLWGRTGMCPARTELDVAPGRSWMWPQDGAGCGQQSCRTFNICTPRQFKQAFEPTHLLIIV